MSDGSNARKDGCLHFPVPAPRYRNRHSATSQLWHHVTTSSKIQQKQTSVPKFSAKIPMSTLSISLAIFKEIYSQGGISSTNFVDFNFHGYFLSGIFHNIVSSLRILFLRDLFTGGINSTNFADFSFRGYFISGIFQKIPHSILFRAILRISIFGGLEETIRYRGSGGENWSYSKSV